MSKDSREKFSDLEHGIKVVVGITALAIFPAGCASAPSAGKTEEPNPPKLVSAVLDPCLTSAGQEIVRADRFRTSKGRFTNFVVDGRTSPADPVAVVNFKYNKESKRNDVQVSPIGSTSDADAFAELCVVRAEYPTSTVALDSADIYDKSTPAEYEVLLAVAKKMNVKVRNEGTGRSF